MKNTERCGRALTTERISALCAATSFFCIFETPTPYTTPPPDSPSQHAMNEPVRWCLSQPAQ